MFKPSPYRIPLWLICLRTFASPTHIRPFFLYNDNIIYKFEKEFRNKLTEKIKTQYNDINWILLITDNEFKFIDNDYYESLFRYFNFLLYEITLLSSNNRIKFYEIIKQFIFNLFDNAYELGVDYVLSSQNQLFELSNKLSNKLEE